MLLTLLQEIEIDLFDTAKTVSTGASGGGITTGAISTGPFGAPDTDRGELTPTEFEATIEKTYDVPFTSPVTVQAPLDVVHD